MNEKIRNTEDLSSIMKSTRPSTVSQIPVPGHILPHSAYTLPSESIAIPATHHPLATPYSMLRPPPLGIGTHMSMTTLPAGKARTTPPADALGPPMFMPLLNMGTPKSSSSNTASYSKPKSSSIAFSQPSSPLIASEMLSSTITNSQPSPFPLLSTSSLLYPYALQQAPQTLSMTQPSSSSSSSSSSPTPQPNMNSKPGGVPIAKPTPVPAVPTTSAQSTSSSKAKTASKSSSFGAKSSHTNSVVRPASPSSSVARIKEGDVQQSSLESNQIFYGPGGQLYIQSGLMIHSPIQPQSQTHSMQQQPPLQTHPSQPQSLPPPQPQSTLTKLLAPSQASKQVPDVSLSTSTTPTTPATSQSSVPSVKSAGVTVGRSTHSSIDKQQLCPPAAVPSVTPKAAANMPFPGSLLTTAGQPTTAAVLTDTRVDRPPQPLVSSGSGVSTGTIPQVTSKDCFDGPNLANNVTGRTFAPPTSISATDLQPTYDQSCSIPPPQSFPLGATAALHLPPQQAVFLLGSQQGGYPMGQAIQHPQQQGYMQQQGMILPSSPGPGSSTNGGLAAAISSASSSTLSPGSSSPRPRILRKRALDGEIKMMDWQITSSANFMNNVSMRPFASGHGAPLEPSVGGAGNTSCPLSPIEHLNNNNQLTIKQEVPVESLTSPRKKPRKQNVVPSDDHYATNVPNEDSTFMVPAPMEAYNGPREEVGEKIKAKREDLLCAEQVPKPSEPRCWNQLRRSPFPINGVYQVYHRAARNHFRRHADIKHREEEHISIQDIANDQSSYPRARGWKLKHFTTQLLEMMEVERGILVTMEKLQETVCSLSTCSSSNLDEKSLEMCKELVQGNVDRSKRVISDLQETQKGMSSILEHKHHVLDLLNKYSTERPSCNGSVALTSGVLKCRDRT